MPPCVMGSKRTGTRRRLRRNSAVAAHDVIVIVVMLMLLMSSDLIPKLLALFLPPLFSRDVLRKKIYSNILSMFFCLRRRKGPNDCDHVEKC